MSQTWRRPSAPIRPPAPTPPNHPPTPTSLGWKRVAPDLQAKTPGTMFRTEEAAKVCFKGQGGLGLGEGLGVDVGGGGRNWLDKIH